MRRNLSVEDIISLTKMNSAGGAFPRTDSEQAFQVRAPRRSPARTSAKSPAGRACARRLHGRVMCVPALQSLSLAPSRGSVSSNFHRDVCVPAPSRRSF